jgi:hypothetical protein
MDKSSSLLQSTTAKIGNMIQGEGGIRHMLVLIFFAFVLVREQAAAIATVGGCALLASCLVGMTKTVCSRVACTQSLYCGVVSSVPPGMVRRSSCCG